MTVVVLLLLSLCILWVAWNYNIQLKCNEREIRNFMQEHMLKMKIRKDEKYRKFSTIALNCKRVRRDRRPQANVLLIHSFNPELEHISTTDNNEELQYKSKHLSIVDHLSLSKFRLEGDFCRKITISWWEWESYLLIISGETCSSNEFMKKFNSNMKSEVRQQQWETAGIFPSSSSLNNIDYYEYYEIFFQFFHPS